MVLYLLRDLLRRNWTIYALMGPIIGVAWIPIALGHFEPRWGMTLSLFSAAALGPMTSMTTIGLREIRLLPIRFRDLWTLTWLASTVVPALFVLLTSSAGVGLAVIFGGAARVDMGTPGLLSLYSYVFTNAVLVLLPALNYTSRNMQPGATTTALSVSILLFFFGSMGLPYLLAPHLPVSWDEFSLAPAVILAAGVAASFGVLAWRPSAGVGTGVANRSPTVSHRSTPRVMDGLTGVSRVLVPYLALTSALTAATLATCAWYASSRGDGNVAALIGEHVVPMAYMLLGMVSPWMPWARLLKNLPMGPRALNVLFLSTPLVAWAIIAATMLLLEPAVGPAVPTWFTSGALMWFSGMTAMVNALAFRHQGAFGWVIIPAAATGPIVRGLTRDALGPGSLWLVLLAVVAFTAAAWINHLTLTRCGSASRAFRRPATGLFSAGGPAAPRIH